MLEIVKQWKSTKRCLPFVYHHRKTMKMIDRQFHYWNEPSQDFVLVYHLDHHLHPKQHWQLFLCSLLVQFSWVQVDKREFKARWCFWCCSSLSKFLSLSSIIFIFNNLISHVISYLSRTVGSYIYITGLREASDRGLAMVLLGFLMFTPGR